MLALRPTYEALTKELKTATLPAKLRPKTYDEIRAKVLEAPRPILTQKGKRSDVRSNTSHPAAICDRRTADYASEHA